MKIFPFHVFLEMIIFFVPNVQCGNTGQQSAYLSNNVYEPPKVKMVPWSKDVVNIKELSDFTARCVVSGHPMPKIEWSLTGADLSKRSVNLTSRELNLKRLQRNENGRITCKATNGFGNPAFATQRINVLYLDKPIITIHTPKIDIISTSSMWFENTIHIRCEVKSNPSADFTWHKNNIPLQNGQALREGVEIRRLIQYKSDSSVIVMRIKNANRVNYGKYKCTASLGRMGRTYKISDKNVISDYNNLVRPPRIALRSPSMVVANPGDAVRLQCDILDGFPTPDVQWSRKDLPMPNGVVYSSNRLNIDIIKIRSEDAGRYYCTASNNVNEPVRKKVEVVIRYVMPMQFWIVPDPLQDDRRLALGSDIKLVCNANGQPNDELVYTWYKQNSAGVNVQVNTDLSNNLAISMNKVAEVRKKITFPPYSSNLEIHRIVSDDYGIYVCEATLRNSYNMSVRASIPVTREAAPAKIYPAKSVVTAREGDKTVLECLTVGRPVPQIAWSRESNTSAPIKATYSTEGGKLILPNVSRYSAGVYICSTTRVNGFSKISKTNSFAAIELVVNFTADLRTELTEIRQGIGKPLSLSCYVLDAEPSWPLRYIWKKNGKIVASFFNQDVYGIARLTDGDYGEYTCNVINYVGTSTCIIRVHGRAYAPEFYFKNVDKSGTTATVFPEMNGGKDLFVYLLSWTQNTPDAVDRVAKYRIRWRKIIESTKSNGDLQQNVEDTWSTSTMLAGDVAYGSLITYELHNLTLGKYQVEVTPVTRFGNGDSATREITVTKTKGPRPTLRGPSFFCNFTNKEICGFLQEKSLLPDQIVVQNDQSAKGQEKTDTFDWMWNNKLNQLKRTDLTGPQYDHTNNLKEGGYVYIEASRTKKGDYSKLVSPMFWDENSLKQCLKFFYSMYGNHIGRLRVLLRTENGKETSIWEKSGNQGQSWQSAYVSIASKVPYQIIFEVTITQQNGYLGDIAIDDVVLADEECPPNPTTSNGLMVQPTSGAKGQSSKSFLLYRNKYPIPYIFHVLFSIQYIVYNFVYLQ